MPGGGGRGRRAGEGRGTRPGGGRGGLRPGGRGCAARGRRHRLGHRPAQSGCLLSGRRRAQGVGWARASPARSPLPPARPAPRPAPLPPPRSASGRCASCRPCRRPPAPRAPRAPPWGTPEKGLGLGAALGPGCHQVPPLPSSRARAGTLEKSDNKQRPFPRAQAPRGTHISGRARGSGGPDISLHPRPRPQGPQASFAGVSGGGLCACRGRRLGWRQPQVLMCLGPGWKLSLVRGWK